MGSNKDVKKACDLPKNSVFIELRLPYLYTQLKSNIF